jgi:hypothetical protein
MSFCLGMLTFGGQACSALAQLRQEVLALALIDGNISVFCLVESLPLSISTSPETYDF